MTTFLLFSLLLQDPMFMGPLASVPFAEERMEWTGQNFELHLDGFTTEDFFELSASDALKNQIVIGMADIEGRTLRSQAESYYFSRDGSAMHLKPLRQNQRAIISLVVPDGISVVMFLNGNSVFKDAPFKTSVFIHGGKAASMQGYGIVKAIGERVVKGELTGVPVTILGQRYVPANTLKVDHEERPAFTPEERAELDKLQAERQGPVKAEFEVYVSPLGQVTNARPLSRDLPPNMVVKAIGALQKMRFVPVPIDGRPGPFVTYWTLTLTSQK